jgi:membrane protein CcdC involved in cytochrome C biogenesis
MIHIPGLTATFLALAVLALRRRRLSRDRRLNLASQWRWVLFFAVITALPFGMTQPSQHVWLLAFVTLAIGIVFGCVRTRAATLYIGQDGELVQRMSSVGMGLLILILCLRPLLREAISEGVGIQTLHRDLPLLALAFGSILGARIELTVRARRLLRSQRG